MANADFIAGLRYHELNCGYRAATAESPEVTQRLESKAAEWRKRADRAASDYARRLAKNGD